MARAHRKRRAASSERRRMGGSRNTASLALSHTLRVVLSHFSGRGVSIEAQQEALKDALRRTGEPLQRHEASAMYAVRGRVELLAAWHRQDRYIGENGLPLPLPLRGTPSLSELFERYLPTSDPAALAAQLQSERVIQVHSAGTWLPERRTLMVQTQSDGATARIPFQVGALLSTLAHNGATAKASQRRLERSVYVDRLPVECLPDFDEYTRRLGTRIIEELDNWLMRREAPADATVPTISAGLSLFSFVESADTPDAPATARRRPRRRT